MTLPNQKLLEFGIDENEVVISLSPGKRWVYKLNGKMCTQGMIELLLEDSVHFHQQNSQTGLLKPKNQQVFLDALLQDQQMLEEYSKLYHNMKELERFMDEVHVEKVQRELEDLQAEIEYFDRLKTF